MKRIRTSLVVLIASAGLALAAEPAAQSDASARHEQSTVSLDAARLRAAAQALEPTEGEPAKEIRSSGALRFALRKPGQALQLINPFAPASYGGLDRPAVASRGRVFVNPATQDHGIAVVNVALK